MNKDFSYYLSKYLKDYLIIERNLSSCTIKSYKNTFKILIDYLVNIKDLKLTNINFNNITRDIIVEFLNYLEEEKHNSINTRNQRLACIKSFCEYCLLEEIENINNIKQILSIKSKKFPNKVINYLTEDEIKEILYNIDTSTKIGRRNLMILSLLYETAARASEIINLKVEDIHLEDKYVILTGKGDKQRVVPISDNVVEILKVYFKENVPKIYLITLKEHQVNDWLLRDITNKYTKNIDKTITPHTFRHSRAIHLLSAGVPLIYIRDLLGHESVVTTERYAKVMEQNKFKAIEENTKDIVEESQYKDWNNDPDLLSQLLNL